MSELLSALSALLVSVRCFLRGLPLFFRAAPETPLVSLMEHDVITVQVTERADEAARLLMEYGLYALPVRGEGAELLGIMMVDNPFGGV